MDYESVRVECYSSYRLNERPVAFIWRGQRREIAEIMDRWYEGGIDPTRPETSYFKVRILEGQIYLLRYLSLFDAWSIRTDGL